jgi:sugar diacid utilization regulator
MHVSGSYTVLVVRIPDSPPASGNGSLIEALLPRHHLPMAWHRPDVFVALVPVDDIGPWSANRSVLSLAQDFAELVGRSCAVGSAGGHVGRLAETAAIARRVSQAAPLAAVPRHVYTTADIFVEMALAQQPQLDHWLRDVTQRLADGPDLVATLEAYYRADMNRLRTAAELFIHPRTLDYRLQRVRKLIGVEPGSARGVRILSTAVSRLRAGVWG